MVTQDLFGHACGSVFARRPGGLADWRPGPASCANKRCPRWLCARYEFDLRRLGLLAELRNIRDFLGQEAPRVFPLSLMSEACRPVILHLFINTCARHKR